MELKNRSFLKLLDYTPAEIGQLLELAADLKAKKEGRYPSWTSCGAKKYCSDL